MSATESRHGSCTAEAPMVGDHLAMDLLNTEARSQGRLVDYWATNEDVHGWLARHGVVQATAGKQAVPSDLLVRGRKLRDVVRELVTARKMEGRVDIDALNDYLHIYLTSPHLQRDADGAVLLTRLARGDATSSLLGPVAEATAQLLAEGDFALVRQCEHPDCILWFYDRTKSHKRRWCSMAQCGNRHKAAQFRKRSGGVGVVG